MSRGRSVALALEVGAPLVLLAVWWTASSSSESLYFPALRDIVQAFADLWLFERLSSDILPSLGRMTAGYLAAAAIGILGGLALGSWPRVLRAVEPLVDFLRSVPPPALLPLAIVLFGIGNAMKIFIIVLVCVWPVLLNTVDGVRAMDPTMAAMARVYRVTGLERLRTVTLPAAAPQIFAGLRTSLSLALIMMVVSEMIASSNGIGHFVIEAQRTFAVTDMWAGILLIGILGYLINAGFVLLERRVLRWYHASRT